MVTKWARRDNKRQRKMRLSGAGLRETQARIVEEAKRIEKAKGRDRRARKEVRG